jgi:hypothetical protein
VHSSSGAQGPHQRPSQAARRPLQCNEAVMGVSMCVLHAACRGSCRGSIGAPT